MPANKKLRVGDRFGRLVVMAEAGNGGSRGRTRMIVCRCDCGTERVFSCPSVLRGASRSCGCLQAEGAADRCKSHGNYGTPTYRTWHSMRDRCLNQDNSNYPLYGGRGVKIDPRWDDFAVFLSDVGERPSLAHSLDRWPNKNGNYEPGNVRWATGTEQSRNRNSNVLAEIDGRIATLAEWAEIGGLKYNTLHARLQNGWPIRDAVFTPARSYSR